MLRIALAFLLLWPATSLAASVPASSAVAYVGQTVTVEGVVGEVHTARSGKATFIDLDGRYPNQPFTAVIFADDMAAVGGVSDLEGTEVSVTGHMQMYRGRPEIIVHSRAQIRAE